MTHKLRSALTILGIVVGVATVIGMVSAVEGFHRNVKESFESFGATLVQFQKFDPSFGPGNRNDEEARTRENLTYADAKALKELCPSMKAVSPERYWFARGPEGTPAPTVTYGDEVGNSDILAGVNEDYPAANNKAVGDGRFISSADVRRSASVTVIGFAIAETLFPYADPIGKIVTISGRSYQVVGVMEEQPNSFFESTDAHVYLPLTTFDAHYPWIKKETGVNIATIPKSPELVDQVTEEGIAVLRARRGVRFNEPNDFGILTPDKLMDNFRAITNKVSMAMVGVAAIALLVGGIGIMNIMLVTVTERTREIGVRKATGALERDILVQFLTEAMSLSGMGGAIGVALGLAIAAVVRMSGMLPAATPMWSIALGLSVSISIGLFFGIYPAMRAARLDPVEALRFE